MPMRVTYLYQYFTTLAQFGSTRAYELSRRLVARGHEVTMITSDRSGEAGVDREEIIDGIRVLWIPVAYDNSMSYPRRMAAFASFAWRSSRLAGLRQCDVIYASSAPLSIALPAMHASWRRTVPWVLEVRDLWPENPVAMGALPSPMLRKAAFMLADRAYASAAHIVALSSGMEKGIVARGVSPAKITTIPNGSDVALFDGPHVDRRAFRAAHPELGDRQIVLYAGAIGKLNGLEYMVDMARCSRSRDAGVAFVVVGAGGQAGPVRELAARAGVLGRNFYMYPPVPKASVCDVFAAADVTLSLVLDHATFHDNSANKFFDSLAAGRPIAINHEGWLAEVIRRNGVGLVLPARRPDAGAEALLGLLDSPGVLRRMGAAARDLARRQFDRDQLFRALERVLLGVAKG